MPLVLTQSCVQKYRPANKFGKLEKMPLAVTSLFPSLFIPIFHFMPLTVVVIFLFVKGDDDQFSVPPGASRDTSVIHLLKMASVNTPKVWLGMAYFRKPTMTPKRRMTGNFLLYFGKYV